MAGVGLACVVVRANFEAILSNLTEGNKTIDVIYIWGRLACVVARALHLRLQRTSATSCDGAAGVAENNNNSRRRLCLSRRRHRVANLQCLLAAAQRSLLPACSRRRRRRRGSAASTCSRASAPPAGQRDGNSNGNNNGNSNYNCSSNSNCNVATDDVGQTNRCCCLLRVQSGSGSRKDQSARLLHFDGRLAPA